MNNHPQKTTKKDVNRNAFSHLVFVISSVFINNNDIGLHYTSGTKDWWMMHMPDWIYCTSTATDRLQDCWHENYKGTLLNPFGDMLLNCGYIIWLICAKKALHIVNYNVLKMSQGMRTITLLAWDLKSSRIRKRFF